jgi:LPS sulfotransferase NodH
MDIHLIYTEARSGSNYLVDLFNFHPGLVNYGEVLGDWTKPHQVYKRLTRRSPDRAYLQFIYTSRLFFYLSQIYYAYQNFRRHKPISFKRRSQIRSLGIKDFHHTFKKYHLLDFLAETPSLRIIYLYRKNILKQHISLELMRTTNIVSTEMTRDGKATIPSIRGRVHVDSRLILDVLANAEAEISERNAVLSRVSPGRIYSIAYEDLFASPSSLEAFRLQVFQFLGVEPIEVASRQRKLSSDDLRELVVNYEELYAELIDTPFAKYLD